jgi:hypothetical protein
VGYGAYPNRQCVGIPPIVGGIAIVPGNFNFKSHLTECGRAHDCKANGRRFKSRH